MNLKIMNYLIMNDTKVAKRKKMLVDKQLPKIWKNSKNFQFDVFHIKSDFLTFKRPNGHVI